MKYDDLEFKEHPLKGKLTIGDPNYGLYDNHVQAIWENEEGTKVSIICDMDKRVNGKRRYEVLMTHMDGKEVSAVPLADLTRKQMLRVVSKVMS